MYVCTLSRLDPRQVGQQTWWLPLEKTPTGKKVARQLKNPLGKTDG